jgi:hypothetical protein
MKTGGGGGVECWASNLALTCGTTSTAECFDNTYSAVATLLLQFMVHIMLLSMLNVLCFYSSAFRSMYAVRNAAIFCSSLTSCFPGVLLRYF